MPVTLRSHENKGQERKMLQENVGSLERECECGRAETMVFIEDHSPPLWKKGLATLLQLFECSPLQ
jgi:hypothetical protein